jgi:hypothetical protein
MPSSPIPVRLKSICLCSHTSREAARIRDAALATSSPSNDPMLTVSLVVLEHWKKLEAMLKHAPEPDALADDVRWVEQIPYG